MASSTVAGVYATALLELARERGTTTPVVDACRLLVDALSPEVLRPLDDPRVGRDQAKRILAEILAGKPREIIDLVRLLIDRNRLTDTGSILRETVRQHEAAEGIVQVSVTVATELSPAGRSRLIERLRARHGARANIDIGIDPSLISGFTARIGDTLVDASGRRTLSDMRSALRTTVLSESVWSA